MSNDQHRDETPMMVSEELSEGDLDGVSGGLSGWCGVPAMPSFKPKPAPTLSKPQPSILIKLK